MRREWLGFLLLLYLASPAYGDGSGEARRFRWPSEHWANAPSEGALAKFKAQHRAFPCERIPAYLRDKDYRAVYWAIRDAGLFRDSSRKTHFKRGEMPKGTEIDLAFQFYRYRLGDTQRLKSLLREFDALGDRPGDTLLFEIFGFLPDWERSGRRLARSVNHVDGAAASLLLTSLEWKRTLYGDQSDYLEECKRVAREERVPEGLVDSVCGSPRAN